MSDITERSRDWLFQRHGSAEALSEAYGLVDEAMSEIHRLRITLAKVARLGSNAPNDSYLDECSRLAFDALHPREKSDAQ